MSMDIYKAAQAHRDNVALELKISVTFIRLVVIHIRIFCYVRIKAILMVAGKIRKELFDFLYKLITRLNLFFN